MTWQYTPFVFPLLVTAAISGAIVVYAWQHRRSLGATPFALLMLGVAAWSLIYALRLVSVEPITVTYNGGQDPELWDVEVGLSSIAPQAQGVMTIFHEYENGGTYYLEVPATTRWVFTRTTDSQERVYDPAPAENSSGPLPVLSRIA